MHRARYAIDPAAALPLTETLPLAETAQRCLMGVYGRLTARDGVKGLSPVISGRAAPGSPDMGTVTTCLRRGRRRPARPPHPPRPRRFGPEEVRALQELRLLKPRRDAPGAGPPVPVALVGLGRTDEFRPGPARASSVWLSATPFLAPDHPKTRGRWRDTERGGDNFARFLAAQFKKELARWLDRRRIELSIESVDVRLLLDEAGVSRRFDPISGDLDEPVTAFRRSRWKHGDDGGRRLAGFFRVEFPREVPGPLSLGYSSHFGMGLFQPMVQG